ncbi:MAG: hypothetical protein J6V15_05890, partial [Clostridia bacterium]|nr:hypothetical protein [Clostridia bacterium]
HEEEQGDERNVAARSYDLLLEQCRSNEQKFYFCDDITNVGKKTSGLTKTPFGEVWGRINDVKKILPDGKVVIQEIAIYKNVAEKILAEHGYHSVPTCIAAWKE